MQSLKIISVAEDVEHAESYILSVDTYLGISILEKFLYACAYIYKFKFLWRVTNPYSFYSQTFKKQRTTW